MKDPYMSDVDNYTRYESPALKEWKTYSFEEQLKKVKELSHEYSQKLEVISVKHQAIEVNLFMEKSEVYHFLVQYESDIRKKLGDFPIIVLLKDRADENRKRK